jgi:flotillin
MEVKVAQAKAEEEIAKAQKKAEEEKLRSTTIVSESVEADRKVIEAEGYKKKLETEAEAEANAVLTKAKAEAEAIRLKKLAEAEGDLKLAEVRAANIAAETENIANLKRAGLGDGAIVSWAMKEEYKNIAASEVEMISKLNLGQVSIIGGSGEAGSFLLDVVRKVKELSSVKDIVPGVTGLFNKIEQFDQKNDSSDDQPKPEAEK